MQANIPVATEKVVHTTAVHETVKPTQLQEIQPIVHREIEKTEVHQITQPIIEKNVLPTTVQNVVLPTQSRPDVVMGGPAPVMAQDMSTRHVETAMHTTMVKPAIVENVIRPHIIEEIQPVVYREVVAPSVIQTTQPITEHVYEAPIVTKTVAAPIYSTGVSAPLSGFSTMQNALPGQNFAQPHNFGGHHPFGIGIPLAQRPAFYENKAALARQNGNMAKAQRNQDKALKSREKLARRSAPGYQRRTLTPGVFPSSYPNRITSYETRATRYETAGDHQRAIRNRHKANFLRQKAGVTAVNYPVHPSGAQYIAQPNLMNNNLQTTPGHSYAPAGIAGSRLGLKGLEKALFFDNKAAEWNKAGNATKAQRNHDKASRIRAKLADSNRPNANKVRTPGSLTEKQATKIAKFEQRATLADQHGKTRKAIGAREKANHIRMKSGVPHSVYPGQSTTTATQF